MTNETIISIQWAVIAILILLLVVPKIPGIKSYFRRVSENIKEISEDIQEIKKQEEEQWEQSLETVKAYEKQVVLLKGPLTLLHLGAIDNITGSLILKDGDGRRHTFINFQFDESLFPNLFSLINMFSKKKIGDEIPW